MILRFLNAPLRNFHANADRIGLLFETFIFNKIKSLAYTRSLEVRISTYRTERGAEFDIILELEGQLLLVEVIASKYIGNSDCGIQRHSPTFFHNYIVLKASIEKDIAVGSF
ncbi:MAG: DUF4143 domain-containing protein [Bdellovibrio sp.]